MTAVQVKITDTADDGSELVDFGDLSTTEAAVASGIFEGFFGELNAFFRFVNVTVPQGATIDSATLTLNIINISGTPNTSLYGVDVDNAAAFVDPGNMPSTATRTTASADPDPTGTGTKVITITAIVQEIVNRGGWASGNAMAFVIDDNAGSGTHYWEAEDLEAGPSDEAQLDITYTAGASAAGPLVAGKLVGRGILGGRLIA